jgi:curved DNA-binding protein
MFQVRLEIDLEEAYRGATRSLQLPEADGVTRTITLRIPAGVTEGETVHTRIGEGAAAVEVLAEIHLRKHRLFETEGRDVVLMLPVAPWELALGATVQVPTLDGKVEMRIPAGTQGGQRLRLKGRGLPGNPPGSEIVILRIVLPAATTAEAKAVYETMRRDLAFDPRAGL